MQQQESACIGRSSVVSRRKRPLARGIVAEHGCIGSLHYPPMLPHLRRHIVSRAVVGDHTTEVSEAQPGRLQIALIRPDQRGQVCAGTMPHQDDPTTIDSKFRRAIEQRLERLNDILDLRLDRDVGHQPIVDRGVGIALSRQMRRQPPARCCSPVAVHPRTAMDKHHQRRGTVARRNRPDVQLLRGKAAIGKCLADGRAARRRLRERRAQPSAAERGHRKNEERRQNETRNLPLSVHAHPFVAYVRNHQASKRLAIETAPLNPIDGGC